MEVSRSNLAMVTALLLLALSGASAQSTNNCTSAANSLAPCLTYVTGTDVTPALLCCSALTLVNSNTPDCLCQVVADLSSSSAAVNVTKAYALPAACSVPFDATTCPALAPSAAPAVAPVVAPSTAPAVAPSTAPVVAPSTAPVVAPSTTPAVAPSTAPAVAPSVAPSGLATPPPPPGTTTPTPPPPPSSPAGNAASALSPPFAALATVAAFGVCALFSEFWNSLLFG